MEKYTYEMRGRNGDEYIVVEVFNEHTDVFLFKGFLKNDSSNIMTIYPKKSLCRGEWREKKDVPLSQIRRAEA